MIALATTNAAYVIFAVTLVGFVVFYFLNRRSARDELGSEQETAPNRKPYFDDEVLEGKRLERYQFVAVLLLAVLVIALPLYWVLEPDRQAGAKEHAAEPLRHLGLAAVRDHGEPRLQLRRLPWRHDGHRRQRAVRRHRPADR